MPHSIARGFSGRSSAALRAEPIPPDLTLEEERALLLHHYCLVCERFGTVKGTVLMRKYACCYAQGRYGAPRIPHPSFPCCDAS